MATPPHNDAPDDSGPRRLDPGPGPLYHARPLRALPRPNRFGPYLANAVAIVIAVVLAPVLTASQASVGVPRSAATAAGTTSSSPAAAVASSGPTQDERFSTQAPQQQVPDRNAQRQGVDDDHDDTLAAPPPGKTAESNGSDFVSPVPGPITGAFGQRFHPILHYWRMHNGVDMTAACGTVVIAAYRGTVIQAGVNGGYGNLVVIDHGRYEGKHVISKYAHLSRIGVRVGDKVETGQGIALSGTTGLSTGCHLHFEIQENGVYVDPAPYLTGKPSPRPDGPIEDLGPSTSPSASASPKPAPTASVTPSSTPTPTRSATAKPTRSATPSPTRSATATPTPTATVTQSATASATPTPSETGSATPTPSPSATERTPDPKPSATEQAPDPEPSATGNAPDLEPSRTQRATPSPTRSTKDEQSSPSPKVSAKEEETPSPSAQSTP